jgi:DNA polymerase-3 subunit beta
MVKTKNPTIKLQRESLKNVLRFVYKVVPSNPPLPILSSLLFSISNKTLTLSSTDLYFGIRSQVATTSDAEVTFAVPGSIFKDLISSFESEVVEIEVLESKIRVSSGKSSAEIPTQPHHDYPEFPDISGKVAVLPTEVLREIDDYICFAAGTDQTRPILTTLLLKMKENGVEAVATDGFRLATLMIDEIGCKSETDILIPAKYFTEVRSIAEQSEVDQITIYAENELKQLKFEVGHSSIYVRLIEGEYPPYEKIIPTHLPLEAAVDGEELKRELKRAHILAREVSNIVELELGGKLDNDDKDKKNKDNPSLGSMVIRANSANQGKYEGVCSLNSELTQVLPIAFNVNYLLDFLTNCSPEELTIYASESLKPVLITVSGKDNYRYVVMPFRVSST